MKIYRFGLIILLSAMASGQESASLAGGVIDTALNVVDGAKVTLTDLKRDTRTSTATSGGGLYVFEGMQPGDYLMEIEKQGYHTLRIERLHMAARDRLSLTFRLEPAEEGKQTVKVSNDVEAVSVDLSSAVAVERDYAESLPVNGRNLQQLMMFMPGVISPAGGIGSVDELNVNGLQASTNYYMVDGVSANRGASGRGGMLGAGGGGRGGSGGAGISAGRGSATGFANDLLPLEAVEQVRVQTSTFSPEFGRTPGAQISVTSRAGGNRLSGSVCGIYGDNSFGANDWFGNRYGLARSELQHKNYGASLGGPIVGNRSYFYAAYEGLRSTHPESSVNFVPDVATRTSAPIALRPYLEAFPVPKLSSAVAGAGIFASAFSNPFDADSASLRLDHSFSDKLQGFVRASWMPSNWSYRGDELTTANVITSVDNKVWSAAGAMTWTASARTSNDLRFGISNNALTTAVTMDSFGGATPLSTSLIFPAGVNAAAAEYRLGVLGLGGYAVTGGARTKQMQWNVVNNLTTIKGAHSFKFGVDFRRTTPTYDQRPYAAELTFNGLSGDSGSLLSGIATAASISSNMPRVEPVLNNFSFYFQDNWKADDRTTVTYGMRWSVNPAPDVRSGSPPFALASDGATVTRFSPLYKTRWSDIGPRFGMAHQLENTPGWEAVLRMGFGIFHDLGYGTTMSSFNGVPYSSQTNLLTPAFPLTATAMIAPTLPAAKPYGRLSVSDPFLKSPSITQWNISLEQTIAHKQTLTMSYIGNSSSSLMLTETQAAYTSDYDFLRITSNAAESAYHAGQLQYRRRFSSNLLAQLSYTYSNSMDTLPGNSSRGGFVTVFSDERGPSDFDVRHALAASANYRLPGPTSGAARRILGDWWLDGVVFARTAMPMDILTLSSQTSENDNGDEYINSFAQVRPDYDGDYEVWISDANAPGGRVLNPLAFTEPEVFGNGNLGRNALRGFGAFQLDLSLRKQLSIGERMKINVFAQAYNVFNKTNFANLTAQEGANLASPAFGYATRTLNVAGGGGAGSMYRIGSPRTMQFGLRFTF
jgi:outer membrane receptor protein involved in Fe transport